MANKKLTINVTEDQLETLYKSLKNGTPLQIALQNAQIRLATYYYWVAIWSIVTKVKSEEEIEQIEQIAKSGINIETVRNMADADSKGRKTGIGTYIEPNPEGVLQYKNSKRFKEYADKIYDIISKCNQIRASVVDTKLNFISASSMKKNGINPSGAMWFLERNLPDFFAKPNEKGDGQDTGDVDSVKPIEVVYVDPNSKEYKQRIIDMETEIEKDYKTGGSA